MSVDFSGVQGNRGLPMQELDFDVRDAIDTVVSRAKLVAGSFIAVVILSAGYAFFDPPVYQADALIQVEEKKGSGIGGLEQIATALQVGQSETVGEIEIIRSREVIFKAIAALHLDIETAVKWKVPYFASKFEQKIGGKGQILAVAPFGGGPLAWGGEELEVSRFEIPFDSFGKSFYITALPETGWKLTDSEGMLLVTAPSPGKQAFLLEGKQATIEVARLFARPGTTFKLTRIPMVRAYKNILDRLKVAETARQSSVIRVSAEGTDPVLTVDLVNEIAKAYLLQNVSRRSEEAEKSLEFLDQQLPELKKQVESAEQALNAYRLSRQSVNLDKESEALLTRSIDLEKTRLETEFREKLLAQRFQPASPEVQGVEGQLSEINRQSGQLAEEIKRLPETQQEFFRLQRDVKVTTDLYIALLNSAQQLRIEKAGTIGNVHIVDFATMPDVPLRPSRTLVMSAGVILGLLVGVIAAYIAKAFRPTLRHADEIERKTGLSTYATVPESRVQRSFGMAIRGKKSPEGKALRLLSELDPQDPAIEALRGMRLGLQFAMVDAANNVVVITGPLPGIGKTFVSVNLAAVLAASGLRILLVDTDMRRPRVGDYFGIKRGEGLSDYLAGSKKWADVIHHAVRPNLSVVTAGSIPPNPGELISLSRFRETLRGVAADFDYIVLDTPPVLPVSDTLAVASFAAATFLVVRAEASTLQECTDSLRRFESAGISAKGIIFNAVKQRRLGYGYQYYYHYSSS